MICDNPTSYPRLDTDIMLVNITTVTTYNNQGGN